jgi:hypothetical protein
MDLNCQFSDPVNYTGSPPAEGEPFAFSGMSCSDDKFSLQANGTSGANFYIDKTISYGQILIIFFVLLFFVFGVFKMMWNFHNKNYSSKL